MGPAVLVKLFFLLCLRCCGGRSTICPGDDDKQVLQCFRSKLDTRGGISLSSWDSANFSSWKGIEWNSMTEGSGPTNVLSLNLSSAGLSGSTWPFWCRLPFLEVLDLSSNVLTGQLNFKGGTICQRNASRIRVLVLRNNSFTGHLPASIWSLQHLEHLDLGDNDFTGSIPYGIGFLNKLEQLLLDHNQLSGAIPTTLFNCSRLNIIALNFNNLSGTVPYELQSLLKLQYLNLGTNKFTGPIPVELGSLSALQLLNLQNNWLTGPIPATISNCSSLSYLILLDNMLTGSIPDTIGNLTQLKLLALAINSLQGRLPQGLGRLTRLKYLDVGYNQFSGPLPDSIQGMASVKIFSVAGNYMTGSIPAWIGNWSHLQQLFLPLNEFTGVIPKELGSLQRLSSYENQIEDDPDLLNVVTGLDLSGLIGGNVKGQFLYRYNYFPTMLTLCFNRLTGSIPEELGKLQNLQYLQLCDNRLTGVIPAALGNATRLTLLHLNVNLLSGGIPVELSQLAWLSQLNVSSNRLSGRIPRSGQMSTLNDPSGFAGNPGLCGEPLENVCTAGDDVHVQVEEDEGGVGWSFVGFAVGVTAAFPFGVYFGRFIVLNKWLNN